MKYIFARITFGLVAASYMLLLSAQPLPPASVPGSFNPLVTQGNIRDTICRDTKMANGKSWIVNARPSSAYTNKLKLVQMKELGIEGPASSMEQDHRIPIELGGNPTDHVNLWPEAWAGLYGARKKDRLENAVHRDICAGRLTLAAGRAIFMGNWWVEYKRRYEKRK